MTKQKHPSSVKNLIMVVNFLNSTSLPREETFSDMLTYTLFSTYKLKSLTSVMVVVNSIIYLSTLAYSGIANGGFLLEPKQEVSN